MESSHNSSIICYSVLLNTFTSCQRSCIKGHLVDIDNRFNVIFLSFTPFHSELSSGHRIINNFSDHFSFNLYNKKNKNKIHLQQLNNMVIELSNSPSTTIVVMNASIKNNIATSILHIHIANKPIIKILHHIVHVTSTETELFTIRCGINQTTNCEDISKIIIITNSIYVAKKIFDPLLHPYQVHIIAILSELRNFFSQNQNNIIKFWECPNCFN